MGWVQPVVYTEVFKPKALHGSKPARHIFKYNADEKVELPQAVLGGLQSGPNLVERNQAESDPSFDVALFLRRVGRTR